MKKILKILAILSNFVILIYFLTFIVISIKEGFVLFENAFSLFFIFFIILPAINIFSLLLNQSTIKLKFFLKIIAVFLNFSFPFFYFILSLIRGSGHSLFDLETIINSLLFYFVVYVLYFIIYLLYPLINIFALLQDSKELYYSDKAGLFFKNMRYFLFPEWKKIILTTVIVLVFIFLSALFIDPLILNFPVDALLVASGCDEWGLCWDGAKINYMIVIFNALNYLIIFYPLGCFFYLGLQNYTNLQFFKK